MNHIDMNAIALANNPKAFTCPVVVEGMAFDALQNLTSALWPIISKLDHAQRPAEPARGEPTDSWYVPAHEPQALTYDEQRLITAFVMAQDTVLVAAIKSPDFAHARTRYSSTYIYHRDRTSPSGVKCAAVGSPEKVDPLVREHRRTSPLSPTEGLATVR